MSKGQQSGEHTGGGFCSSLLGGCHVLIKLLDSRHIQVFFFQFLTRNPNFRSKIARFYSQEGKHRKNEFRKNIEKTLIHVLTPFFGEPPREMDREVICPSTVQCH